MKRTIPALSLALALSIPEAAGADTCPPRVGTGSGDSATLCSHVVALRCPSVGRSFTGFQTEVGGRGGILTALHAVVDCAPSEITLRGAGRRLTIEQVDLAHDAAFLVGAGLPGPGLTQARAPGSDRLRVVGYALGASGQSGIFLDRMQPQLDRLSAMLPDDLKIELARRGSPDPASVVLRLVGELNRDHSGAPILNEAGEAVAFGDGGLKERDSDQVWAIPLWQLQWSTNVEGARRRLAGTPGPSLAAYGAGAAPPRLPPIYFVGAFDRAGPIYRTSAGGTSISWTWGASTIYSVAVNPNNGRLTFVNSNDTKIYEVEGGRARVIHTHGTYVDDIAFDSLGRLYFSEASGAGANGKIFRLWRRVAKVLEIRLDHIGYWAGDFAFAPDDTIWLSQGNVVPAGIFEVRGGRPELRFMSSGPIAGFVFLDNDTIAYSDWSTGIHTLYLPTMTEAAAFTLGTAQHLSDVALVGRLGVEERRVFGYLLAPFRSISTLGDIRKGMTICGNLERIDRAVEARPELRAVTAVAVPASEVYGALESGLCDAWLVADPRAAAAMLGFDANALNPIAIAAD